MEGPKNTNLLPILSQARVLGYDSLNHAVLVSLPSMQQISVPAKILYIGTSDATRIEQMPLPVIGTWGLVAFPYGLIESAIWLGSFYQTGVTAVNTSKNPTDGDGQQRYMSHASGSWSLLDYIGQYAMTFGDNTQFLVNASNQTPTTYRRVVDSEGVLTSVPYYQSDRNPSPPPPFWISLNHPGSGASWTISPSGEVTILGGGPHGSTQALLDLAPDGTATLQGGEGVLASLVIQPNGITTIQTGGNPGAVGSGVQVGPTAVFDPQAGLITITGANSKSKITMDINGAVVVTAANGSSSITMDQSGNISVQATGNIDITSDEAISIEASSSVEIQAGAAVTVQSTGSMVTIEALASDIFLVTDMHVDSINTMINTFNAHVHSGVTPGSSDTQPPTTPMP